MAVTKIHKINRTLDKAIKYILNDEKTMEGMLVSTYQCSKEYAFYEFEALSRLYHPKHPRNHDTNEPAKNGKEIKAYHLIQSFAKDDPITPELALKIGQRYAMEFTGGDYQFLVTTHTDKGHIHNHVIINATSFRTGKKFHLDNKKLKERELLSDRLCREYGLSVIEEKSGIKGRSYIEYEAHKEGRSWKDQLRDAIDRTIASSEDFDDFLNRMELEEGYEVKPGKHIAFRSLDGQIRFTRCKRLGENYTEASLITRIDHKDREDAAHMPFSTGSDKAQNPKDKRIYLIAPIEKRIQFLKEQGKLKKGYENQTIINEINLLVSSFNYLKENNLLYDADFLKRYEDLDQEVKKEEAKADALSEDLSERSFDLRYLHRYQNSKEDARKIKKNPTTVFEPSVYQNEVIYDGAVKHFKKRHINPERIDEGALTGQIEALEAEYEALLHQKNEHTEERKKLYIISQNLSDILGFPLIRSFQETTKETDQSPHPQRQETAKEPQQDQKQEQQSTNPTKNNKPQR